MRDRFQREITFESRVREKSGTRNTEFYSLKPEIDIHCTKAPFFYSQLYQFNHPLPSFDAYSEPRLSNISKLLL